MLLGYAAPSPCFIHAHAHMAITMLSWNHAWLWEAAWYQTNRKQWRSSWNQSCVGDTRIENGGKYLSWTCQEQGSRHSSNTKASSYSSACKNTHTHKCMSKSDLYRQKVSLKKRKRIVVIFIDVKHFQVQIMMIHCKPYQTHSPLQPLGFLFTLWKETSFQQHTG